MKRSQVQIRWEGGLHLRPAARLVKLARRFQSSVSLKLNQKVADARSVLAIVLLCANFGSVIDIEATGPDEADAMAALESVFDMEDSEASDLISVTDTIVEDEE